MITADGFGFVTGGAIVDQHFVCRTRHNRLISLVLESPQRLGVGIDESTVLVIGPDGMWRVVGASVVVIHDAHGAGIGSGIGSGRATLGVTSMMMHVIPAGGSFNPHEGGAELP